MRTCLRDGSACGTEGVGAGDGERVAEEEEGTVRRRGGIVHGKPCELIVVRGVQWDIHPHVRRLRVGRGLNVLSTGEGSLWSGVHHLCVSSRRAMLVGCVTLQSTGATGGTGHITDHVPIFGCSCTFRERG